MTGENIRLGAGQKKSVVNGGKAHAERDLQKDLDAVKEDSRKNSARNIAELTQKLIDTGRSEVSTARNRVRTEARKPWAGIARDHSTRLENKD